MAGSNNRGDGGIKLLLVAVAAGLLGVGIWASLDRDDSPSAPAPAAPTPAKAEAAPPAAAPAARPVPAGSLFADGVRFEIAILHLVAEAGVPADLRKAWGADAKLPLVEAVAHDTPLPAFTAKERPLEDYPLPDFEGGGVTARGMKEDLAATVLEGVKKVTVLELNARPPAFAAVRAFYERALELAKARRGLLWDPVTNELYSPDGWKERRLETWENGLPAMAWNFMVGGWHDEDGPGLTTMGLANFGLPELQVRLAARAQMKAAGALLNCAAQLLAEQGSLAEAGKAKLEVAAIRHPMARESLEERRYDNAKGVVTLDAVELPLVDGDSRLVELRWPEPLGASLGERVDAGLAELFGSEDEVTHIEHDEELLAVSAKARTRLLEELKPRFLKGLAGGERLAVKAPFETTSGGNEWMWLEVTRWEGTTITGILQNEPEDVPSLRPGATVVVEEATLFDFIWETPDGGFGNETGDLMLKRLGRGP